MEEALQQGKARTPPGQPDVKADCMILDYRNLLTFVVTCSFPKRSSDNQNPAATGKWHAQQYAVF